MLRSSPIANETEFQEWLASALEAERQRLCEAAAARESQQYMSFEVAKEKYNEGDTAS
jgi:hypothetical protein